MNCIDVQNWVCDKCGYSTNEKPSTYPVCPVCSYTKIYTSDCTKTRNRKGL
jgi:rubrerythrin